MLGTFLLFKHRLYGSYAAIQGSVVNWALQDLTGGITDSVQFMDNLKLMQRTLDLSMARSTLMAATIAVRKTCASVPHQTSALVLVFFCIHRRSI